MGFRLVLEIDGYVEEKKMLKVLDFIGGIWMNKRLEEN